MSPKNHNNSSLYDRKLVLGAITDLPPAEATDGSVCIKIENRRYIKPKSTLYNWTQMENYGHLVFAVDEGLLY
jgi:hypothetical protein